MCIRDRNTADHMDRRSLYKRLYPLATFKPGNVVYYNGAMHEVIKRFFRFSEQRVLYDLRHARTNMVVQALSLIHI